MTTPTESQSLPELLSTLIAQMSALFRQEIRLAKTAQHLPYFQSQFLQGEGL